jgi:Domain of unknown function (DUF397)
MFAADLENVEWRKNSCSGQGSDCVEVAEVVPVVVPGAVWRKSSFSGAQSDCVEVAAGVTGVVPVRDSKDPDRPALVFAVDAWAAFVGAVRAGELSGA